MNREFDLQLISKYRTPLMGVAMLWIVLFHSPLDEISLPFVSRFIKRSGFGGVDIFFLVSGLGIYFSYTKITLKKFYLRRFTRIIPYYIPIIILFGILFQIPNDLMQWQGLLMRACMMDYWMKGIGLGWFIPVILLFYLLTPLIFKLMKFENKYYMISLIIGLYILAFLTGFVLGWHRTMNDVMFRFVDYVLGIYLGYLIQKNKTISFRKLWSVLLIAIVIACISYYYGYYQSDNLIAAYLFVFPYALMALPLSAFLCTIFARLGSYTFPILSFVGSYTLNIYIFHERIITMLDFYKFPYLTLFSFIFAILCAYLWQNLIDWILKRVGV